MGIVFVYIKRCSDACFSFILFNLNKSTSVQYMQIISFSGFSACILCFHQFSLFLIRHCEPKWLTNVIIMYLVKKNVEGIEKYISLKILWKGPALEMLTIFVLLTEAGGHWQLEISCVFPTHILISGFVICSILLILNSASVVFVTVLLWHLQWDHILGQNNAAAVPTCGIYDATGKVQGYCQWACYLWMLLSFGN